MKTKVGMILMGLAMLASCSQENETLAVTDAEGVIRLGVEGGSGVMTRGVVNTLEALSAEGTKVGLYAVKTAVTDASLPVSADWLSDTRPMTNVQTTSIDKTTGAMKWLNPEVYIYPKNDVDGKNNVKFFAYYPYAAKGTAGDNYMVDAVATTAPKLNFTLTGSEDLMWATPVLGSRTQPAPALKFNHKLTQLSFRLMDGEGSFTVTNGAVTDVMIEANTKGVMNIETGALSDWGTSSSLEVYKGSIPVIGADPVPLAVTLMLQPGQVAFNVTLKAAGKDGSGVVTKMAEIKPMGDATFLAGKAYLITLSLSGNVLIQLGASVVPWVEGGTGFGYID